VDGSESCGFIHVILHDQSLVWNQAVSHKKIKHVRDILASLKQSILLWLDLLLKRAGKSADFCGRG
jgi:hypothetical protein